jgi:hypothetical protein
MLRPSRSLVLLMLGLAALALTLLPGCSWRGSCESDFTVHQPTAQVGLVPQEGVQ